MNGDQGCWISTCGSKQCGLGGLTEQAPLSTQGVLFVADTQNPTTALDFEGNIDHSVPQSKQSLIPSPGHAVGL